MTYVFIRYYNPTYDFFLSRYFRDGGLDVDENLTLEKADSIAETELSSVYDQAFRENAGQVAAAIERVIRRSSGLSQSNHY